MTEIMISYKVSILYRKGAKVMRTTSALLAIMGWLLANAAFAQVPQCTAPHALVNGQIADATDVMENFNAVANCVESAGGDAVTHDGEAFSNEVALS
jgi:hypothetical protein